MSEPLPPGDPSGDQALKLCLPGRNLGRLFGPHDENLDAIQQLMGVRLAARGNEVLVEGPEAAAERTCRLLEQLARLVEGGFTLTRDELKTACELATGNGELSMKSFFMDAAVRITPQR